MSGAHSLSHTRPAAVVRDALAITRASHDFLHANQACDFSRRFFRYTSPEAVSHYSSKTELVHEDPECRVWVCEISVTDLDRQASGSLHSDREPKSSIRSKVVERLSDIFWCLPFNHGGNFGEREVEQRTMHLQLA